VGDGSYIFGAPLAAHWVARAHNLPVLFVIFNNRAWNAVKRSVKAYAPEGWSVRTGVMPWKTRPRCPTCSTRHCG